MATQLGLTAEGYLDVPVTKPATEYLDGRLVQKLSPLGAHARLQGELVFRATLWNRQGPFGWLGPEWDFDLVLPDGGRARVVPDVAYLSYARIPREHRAAAQVPLMAPSVAFEILSPGDPNRPNVRRKLDLYREAGAEAVVVVDERMRTLTLHAKNETRTFAEGDVLDLEAMPGFQIDVAEYFRDADV